MTLVMSVGLLFGISFGFLVSSGDLPIDDVSKLIQLSKNVQTTEEKIDFLYQYRKLSLEARMRLARPDFIGLFSNLRLYAIAVPILAILAMFIYMIKTCYPYYVYSWGDWEEYYEKLIERRKTIWTVIILAFVVGIISNIFMIGIFGS